MKVMKMTLLLKVMNNDSADEGDENYSAAEGVGDESDENDSAAEGFGDEGGEKRF